MLITSICPYFYGWNVENLFNLIFFFFQSVVQNVLRNIVSLYDIMLLSIPKCTQNCLENMCIAPYPLMVFLQRIIIHILLNLSITTNKQLFTFLVVINPPTKPMEMLSQGQVGIGKVYKTLLSINRFIIKQSMCSLIYHVTSSHILGQYT